MDNTNDVVAGRKFDKFDDAVDFVEQYCKQHFHPVKRASRNTVGQYNSKIRSADSRITNLAADEVYSMRWICKHFGKFQSRSNEAKSRNRSHYTRGCDFFIYVAWNKDDRTYEIKSCSLGHNHDTGVEIFGMYAKNRFVYCDYIMERLEFTLAGAMAKLLFWFRVTVNITGLGLGIECQRLQ